MKCSPEDRQVINSKASRQASMVRKPRQQRKNPDKYAVSTNVPARGKEAAGTSRLGQRQSIGVHNVLLSVQSPREDCGLVNPHQRVDSLFSSAGNGSQSQSPHPPSTLSSFAYDPVIGSSKSTLHPGTQPQLSNYVDSLYGGEGYDSVCDAGNSDPTAARTAALALIYNRSQYATSFDSGLYASDHFRSMPQACTNLQHVGEPDNNFPGHGVEDPTPRFGCGEEFAWPLIDQALVRSLILSLLRRPIANLASLFRSHGCIIWKAVGVCRLAPPLLALMYCPNVKRHAHYGNSI